jgi:hypothetical protein
MNPTRVKSPWSNIPQGCRGCEPPCPALPCPRSGTSTLSRRCTGVFCNTLGESENSRQARGLRGLICRVLFCNFWRSQHPETQNPAVGGVLYRPKPETLFAFSGRSFPSRRRRLRPPRSRVFAPLARRWRASATVRAFAPAFRFWGASFEPWPVVRLCRSTLRVDSGPARQRRRNRKNCVCVRCLRGTYHGESYHVAALLATEIGCKRRGCLVIWMSDNVRLSDQASLDHLKEP